jgi:uncharacterized protein (DUF1330 family)
MTVYLIIEITIIDEVMYTEYVDLVYDIVVQYGGRYLVRGGATTSMGGNWHPQRIVVIAFPDRQSIDACFASAAYRKLAPLREQSTQSRAIIVDGFTGDAAEKGESNG